MSSAFWTSGRQPGNYRRLGLGRPYTIAAQIAYPDRQCVAFVGDVGFSILMVEFITAVKYKLPIKLISLKNNTLGQINWEQIAFLGRSTRPIVNVIDDWYASLDLRAAI